MQLLKAPDGDPTSIFEHFRGSYGAELLTAAVAHFDLFGRLGRGPRTLEQLAADLKLARRPLIVLTTALRAMQLLQAGPDGDLAPTALAAAHLTPGGELDVSDYVSLAATAPGVLEMVERLRSNRPAGLQDNEGGAAFIYRAGLRSAMEEAELARHFTLALSGRAKNVAPVLAERAPLDGAQVLLDVGGGTGLYSIAWLQRHPRLRAIVLDRPEVLKIAEEFAAAHGVSDRLELLPGDMFDAPLPPADAVLLSNVLHDWDEPECRRLVARSAEAVRGAGRLIIHDVLLNDALDGPLPIALYSAALFTLTEGRAYSGAEYREWLASAGLRATSTTPTLIHCQAIVAGRP